MRRGREVRSAVSTIFEVSLKAIMVMMEVVKMAFGLRSRLATITKVGLSTNSRDNDDVVLSRGCLG